VVVGSALVKKIEAYPDNQDRIFAEIGGLLSSMRNAMDKK
jgi:tryptophan synthase alpha subunit